MTDRRLGEELQQQRVFGEWWEEEEVGGEMGGENEGKVAFCGVKQFRKWIYRTGTTAPLVNRKFYIRTSTRYCRVINFFAAIYYGTVFNRRRRRRRPVDAVSPSLAPKPNIIILWWRRCHNKDVPLSHKSLWFETI